MGRLDVILEDNLDKKFREKVFKIYGLKKGNIKYALEDAMELWLKTE